MDNYSPLSQTLLRNRGIHTAEDADVFLNPSYERDVSSPWLMKNMDRAVERILQAIKTNEKIVIYADYDCDGIPGAVVLHDFFEKIGYVNTEVYIPDRHQEGYGLNYDAIETFKNSGTKLLITIDLGITNIKEVALLESYGINVIVTDHHLPISSKDADGTVSHDLPQAYAVVNPKQLGDAYPDPMLCGAGVAFKLAQAFLEKHGKEFNVPEGWEKWLLDMAGLATLSDMVPLVKENRALATYGLKVLRQTRRPGLLNLFRKLSMDPRHITEDDLTFMITPRINAASRMDIPRRAFELLSEKDILKAGVLANHLSNINDERKSLVAQIMKEAKHTLGEREEKSVIVLGNPAWRVGVLGLVASKITEEYGRPAFVWGREGSGDLETVKGSCRSDGSASVVAMMSAPANIFVDFGGHELAGGFSMRTDTVHTLEEHLIKSYEQARIAPGASLKNKPEMDLTLQDLSEKTYKEVEQFAPFGLGNQKPVFAFRNVTVSALKEFGKEKNHLELVLTDDSGATVKAISFFKTRASYQNLEKDVVITLHATLERSYFAGKVEKRLRIVAITI